jgi:hypothetical protein
MQSKVAATYEIDDLDLAVQDLLAGLNDGFPLLKNTCGIIFCASDIDQKPFLAKFKARFPHDLVGCTGIATFEHKNGFHEMCTTLLVLTADDCEFAAVLSGAVTPENVREEIEGVWRAAQSKTPGGIKLAIAIPAYNLNIMLDEYTNTFNKIAPGVPLFGGLPSYRGEGDSNMTVFNGEAYRDRLVFLSISGNISPVFSVQNVSGNAVERKRTVTSSKCNTIYTAGGQRFTDYMAEIGLPVDKLVEGNNTITFVSNPLLIENAKGADSSFSFARTLHKIDLAEGSGTAIGEIPEGATMSICSLKRDQIAERAAAGIKDIKEKIRGHAPGYRYSTILAVSCIGRYLLMAPNCHVEADNILQGFPEGLSLAGFYGYGEIAPFCQGEKTPLNFAHNESLVLCAF